MIELGTPTAATNVSVNVVATIWSCAVSSFPNCPNPFGYDADVNMTQDSLRNYSWDAENRLIAIETRTNIVTDSSLWKHLSFDYDHGHRRVRNQVFSRDPNAAQYRLTTSLRFFYDRWNLIGQVEEVSGIRMSFLWGADMSGTLQGALAITVEAVTPLIQLCTLRLVLRDRPSFLRQRFRLTR